MLLSIFMHASRRDSARQCFKKRFQHMINVGFGTSFGMSSKVSFFGHSPPSSFSNVVQVSNEGLC